MMSHGCYMCVTEMLILGSFKGVIGGIMGMSQRSYKIGKG